MATFFPSNHIFENEQILFEHIRPCLTNDTVYDDDMEVPSILEDKTVDVITLLSGHVVSGSRVESTDYLITNNTNPTERRQVYVSTLKGKYVLICCFLVPTLKTSMAAAFSRALIALMSELPEKERQNFEVVIVPKLRTGLATPYWFVFSYPFMSAFPDSCLTMPPPDTYSCDYVCKSLGLSTKTGMAALLVDPQQMVLQHNLYSSSALEKFGTAGFPFTKNLIQQLRCEDNILKMRLDIVYKENFLHDNLDKYGSSPVSLVELLECRSLSNMNTQTQVPVSYFSDKLVGLYIYYDGLFMKELGDVLDDCYNEGRSFEIVVIRLSSLDDPSSILEQVLLGLQKHEISASYWWTFPFNHDVCQKLWRMVDLDRMDKLIIVPPPGEKNRSGDLQGKAVIRKAVIVPPPTVADHRGKNIILYFDDFEYLPCGLSVYNKILSRYSEIQAKYPGSEVVFAPLNASFNPKWELVSKVPWLILPFFCPYLREKLQLDGFACCVAFGEDGRVRSRKADRRLDKVACLFDDHLRKEIVAELYQLNQDYD